MRHRRGFLGLGVVPAAALVGTLALSTNALAAPAETRVLNPAGGAAQSFEVPAGVTQIRVSAVGGAGQGTCLNALGGAGAAVGAVLSVTPHELLYIDFTGGGAAAELLGCTLARGGDASDVRTVAPGKPDSLASRLVVAGGGGGAGVNAQGGNADGGNASGTSGEAGHGEEGDGGEGGGSNEGGLGGKPGAFGNGNELPEAGQRGELGKGGAGAGTGGNVFSPGGGGGGGYYGGGGGASSLFLSGGGGAGSSYLAPEAGQPSFATAKEYEPQAVTLTYTVPGAPVARIESPPSKTTFEQDEVATTSFSCVDGPLGPGISTCGGTEGIHGSGLLDTSQLGQHRYSITAVSKDGMSASTSIIYTVVSACNAIHGWGRVGSMASEGVILSDELSIRGPRETFEAGIRKLGMGQLRLTGVTSSSCIVIPGGREFRAEGPATLRGAPGPQASLSFALVGSHTTFTLLLTEGGAPVYRIRGLMLPGAVEMLS